MLSVGFGLKIFHSMKYKVIFFQDEKEVVLVEGLSDVQACQFAINLHQSSNTVHEIRIFSGEDCLLTLIKK